MPAEAIPPSPWKAAGVSRVEVTFLIMRARQTAERSACIDHRHKPAMAAQRRRI